MLFFQPNLFKNKGRLSIGTNFTAIDNAIVRAAKCHFLYEHNTVP